MTWIRVKRPTPENPDVAKAFKDAMANYPAEYDPARRAERKISPVVRDDSIVLAHSLLPEVMKHVFQAYGAMLDPSLPLSRRDHELIAATVSSLNRCFY